MLEIRLAEEKDAKQITDLMNQVTQALHRKGIQQWRVEYPWTESSILAEIRQNYYHCAWITGSLTASFLLHPALSADELRYTQGRKEVIYLSRLAILPQRQGQGLGEGILRSIITEANTQGKALFLDCWAGNQKLRQFYSRTGFTWLGDQEESDYQVSVFCHEPE